jgi:hypothetical protein
MSKTGRKPFRTTTRVQARLPHLKQLTERFVQIKRSVERLKEQGDGAMARARLSAEKVSEEQKQQHLAGSKTL